MRARRPLSSPTHFSQTLAIASLSPLTCWSLCRRTFSKEPSPWSLHTKPSLQSFLCRDSVMEPSPWSLYHGAFFAKSLYKIVIGPSSEAFVLGLHSGPSSWTFSGRVFIGRPSLAGPLSRTFSDQAFIGRPSPTGPSSWTFSGWAFIWRPSPAEPSSWTFSGLPSSRDLL